MSETNNPPATPEKEKTDPKKIVVEHTFVISDPKAAEKTTPTPATPTPVAPTTPVPVPVVPTPTPTPASEPKEPKDEMDKLKKEKEKVEAELRKLHEDEANPELEGSKAAIQKKLEERTAALNVIALKEFEADKSALLENTRENLKKQGISEAEITKKIKDIDDSLDTPEALERTKWVMEKMFAVPIPTTPEDDGTEPVPPSGQATNPEIPSEYKDHRKLIDGLYNIVADPTKSSDEKAEANRKIGELYIEIGKAYKQTHKLPLPIMMTCPQCGGMITLINKDAPEECQKCGWKQTLKKA